MAKKTPYVSWYIIPKIENHAGYNVEDASYSTFSDDIYVSRKEINFLTAQEDNFNKNYVSYKEDILKGLVAKLNKAKNRLKTETNPVMIARFNRAIKDIETTLFLERDFIASRMNQSVKEFINSRTI